MMRILEYFGFFPKPKGVKRWWVAPNGGMVVSTIGCDTAPGGYEDWAEISSEEHDRWACVQWEDDGELVTLNAADIELVCSA